MPKLNTRVLLASATFAIAVSATAGATGAGSSGGVTLGPKVSTASHFSVFNGSLRDLPVLKPSRHNRLHPREALGNQETGASEPDSTTRQPKRAPNPPDEGEAPTPAATTFAGMTQAETGFVPPDTNGDVGPNHYVQTVNSSYSIYNKTGTRLAGPTAINQIWAAAPAAGGLCQAHNRGDPVVLFDDFADRWLITQFAFDRQDTDMNPATPDAPVAPFAQCAAVSQTADPVNGGWFRYEFPAEDLTPTDTTTRFPDYPKWGVWRDGYYFTANQIGGAGVGAYAVDRTAMLAGQANPQQIYFDQPGEFSMLPPDADGPMLPPVGDPAPFAEVDDGPDQLQIWEFDADFTTPANSTFTQTDTIPVAAFDDNVCSGLASFGNCIPQPGQLGGQWLEALTGQRLMFGLKYRNFGTHETLVANHTIDGNGLDVAGVRWYELRHPGGAWGIQQQGTVSDAATHRWLGSIAMDTAGNIGLAYSASGVALNPEIRYTHQHAGDPAGTMDTEVTMQAGGGVKTCTANQDTNGDMVNDFCRNRWGDYSSISVDPSDACTFWVTNEYYNAANAWLTTIGSFDLCQEATAQASPNPMDFGTEDVGQLGPVQTLTVTNIGDANLSISNVSKLGANPSDFLISNDACEGATVVPNGTCAIDLRFAPSAGGPRAATLRIDSNDANGPLDVALTGIGQAPAPPSGFCGGLPVTIGGATSDDDVILGTPGDDVIRGDAGDDVIRGIGGLDTICGEGGDDDLFGGSGDDVAFGGIGVDKLALASGTDVGRGGTRDDVVSGGGGDDVVFGNEGPDDLRGRAGHDDLRGGPATDRCNGGSSTDTSSGCEIGYLIP